MTPPLGSGWSQERPRTDMAMLSGACRCRGHDAPRGTGGPRQAQTAHGCTSGRLGPAPGRPAAAGAHPLLRQPPPSVLERPSRATCPTRRHHTGLGPGCVAAAVASGQKVHKPSRPGCILSPGSPRTRALPTRDLGKPRGSSQDLPHQPSEAPTGVWNRAILPSAGC